MVDSYGFPTVFGRGLVGELPNFVPRPYLVVTMADLWPHFEAQLSEHLADVHLVRTLDIEALAGEVERLTEARAIIGLGGGRAIDVAKYFAWAKGLPLFTVPTAMSVNAPFGQRSGLRQGGIVRYLGWAVPEAVYVDFEVIRGAPPLLNRSGVGDILCYHTAHWDWRFAQDQGIVEERWPYDPDLVAAARERLDSVLGSLDDIHDVNENGIRTLMNGHRWGGAAFHDAGWNPSHIEGVDHFLFYNLERITGKHFIHGQPVGLGIVFGSFLQDNEPDKMLAALKRAGVDIRPEAMGVTWHDVEEAMRTLRSYVLEAGLWSSVVDVRPVTEELISTVKTSVIETFGAWEGAA